MPYRGARYDGGARVLVSVCADDHTIDRALGCAPLTDVREGLERSMAFYHDYRREYWGEQGCSR